VTPRGVVCYLGQALEDSSDGESLCSYQIVLETSLGLYKPAVLEDSVDRYEILESAYKPCNFRPGNYQTDGTIVGLIICCGGIRTS
jgi:hypothetical protein